MNQFRLILLLISGLAFAQESNPKHADTLNVPIGKVNQYELVYDCSDCRQMSSEGISVYYKQGVARHLMFYQGFGDFYVSEVSLLKIKNDYFVYVGSDHTYGNSQGYLFYLNDKTMKTYPVKFKVKHSIIPTNASVHKYFELTKDENNHFGFGATIRPDNGGEEEYISREYELKKIGENQFILTDKK